MSREQTLFCKLILPGVDLHWMVEQSIRMHFVTSSLFLPILVKHLSADSQQILLRGWFSVVCLWYISRGYAELDIPAVFSRPLPTYPSAIPGKTRYSVLKNSNTTPNPWSHLIDSAIVHADQHLSKTIRALAHYASIYGSTKAGDRFRDTELVGADHIDGTLFLRAASLALDREVQLEIEDDIVPAPLWDRKGYFHH
jgi:hypothetical protein